MAIQSFRFRTILSLNQSLSHRTIYGHTQQVLHIGGSKPETYGNIFGFKHFCEEIYRNCSRHY